MTQKGFFLHVNVLYNKPMWEEKNKNFIYARFYRNIHRLETLFNIRKMSNSFNQIVSGCINSLSDISLFPNISMGKFCLNINNNHHIGDLFSTEQYAEQFNPNEGL